MHDTDEDKYLEILTNTDIKAVDTDVEAGAVWDSMEVMKDERENYTNEEGKTN